MAKKSKKAGTLYIPIRDYGDDWVNRLAAVCMILGKMEERERSACFEFIRGKFLLPPKSE